MQAFRSDQKTSFVTSTLIITLVTHFGTYNTRAGDFHVFAICACVWGIKKINRAGCGMRSPASHMVNIYTSIIMVCTTITAMFVGCGAPHPTSRMVNTYTRIVRTCILPLQQCLRDVDCGAPHPTWLTLAYNVRGMQNAGCRIEQNCPSWLPQESHLEISIFVRISPSYCILYAHYEVPYTSLLQASFCGFSSQYPLASCLGMSAGAKST